MSSWISHLPREVTYARVAGLGMNAEELAANTQLTEWVVHNLNRDPTLPYGDGEFDGASICVSVDYLTQPVAVLRELGRVLKPGAPLVITFSNRCFPTKAIALWHELDDEGHVALVARLMAEAGAFEPIETLDRSPKGWGDPLYAVVGKRKAAYFTLAAPRS
jgi:ubiquinone/menaquinone biosynthesis C-methylase UbiE